MEMRTDETENRARRATLAVASAEEGRGRSTQLKGGKTK